MKFAIAQLFRIDDLTERMKGPDMIVFWSFECTRKNGEHNLGRKAWPNSPDDKAKTRKMKLHLRQRPQNHKDENVKVVLWVFTLSRTRG
jgi:hypothetical protein